MSKKVSYVQIYHNLRKGEVYNSLIDYSKAALELDSIKKLLYFVKVADKIENDEFVANINIIKKNRMKIINSKEVDYDDNKYRNKKKLDASAEQINKKIVKLIDGELVKKNLVIFHTHNLNIGLNPVLTRAMGLLAEHCERKKKPLIILCHVHEFAEEHNRQRLEFVRTIAGKQVDKSYLTSLLYPTGKNIIYIASDALQTKLLKEIGLSQVLLFPPSINVKLYSKKPIYKLNTFNLNKLRIEKIDFKEDILLKIEKYATHKNYFFDRNRKIILAPVMIGKRKNILESLLILKILNSTNDEWQLLISQLAMTEREKPYEAQIIEYIKKHRIPCTAGIGPEILSNKQDRNVIDGIVFQYTHTDLYGISEAIITTSVKEETNNIFLEGWLSGTKIFGRSIPEQVSDLEKNGMHLKHLYDKISIRIDSLKDHKHQLTVAYKERINTLRKEQKQKPLKDVDAWKELLKHKISLKGKALFMDYADLTPTLQMEVLENVPIEELQLHNPTLKKVLSFIEKKNIKIINTNRKVIVNRYSVKSKKEELKKIIKEAGKVIRSKKKSPKVKDNNKILSYYSDLRHISLLDQ